MRYLPLLSLASLLTTFSSFAEYVQRNDSNFELRFVEGNQLAVKSILSAGYIDNFLYQRDDALSTAEYALNTSGFAQIHNDDHLFQAYGEVTRREFEKFKEDDHTELTLLGKYFYRLNQDQRLFVSTGFDRFYEYRGTGLSRGAASTLIKGDKKENTLINAGYQLGSLDTVSRLNFTFGLEQSEYTTRRQVTKIYDYDRAFVQLDVDYLVSGKSYLALDVSFSELTYDFNENLERSDGRALIGAKWSPTKASGVAFLVGYQLVDFTNIDRDEKDIAWRVSYDWSPSDFVSIKLLSARATENQTEVESNVRISDLYQANLIYRFNDRWQLSGAVVHSESDVLLSEGARSDTEWQLSALLTYQFNSSFALLGRYQYTESDSDFLPLNFDRKELTISAEYQF